MVFRLLSRKIHLEHRIKKCRADRPVPQNRQRGRMKDEEANARVINAKPWEPLPGVPRMSVLLRRPPSSSTNRVDLTRLRC
jgi:hypothetical protein